MIEVKGNFKYEITDDLRLNVWHATDNEIEVPPFWYQNVKPSSEPWTSVEEILEYLEPELARFEEIINSTQLEQTTPEE